MNRVDLIGRLTAKPELKQTPNGKAVCNFTIAIDRKFKDANGQTITDYIDCIIWKSGAEFLCKYFDKGVRIGVSGELQTRVWKDKEEKTRKVYEVLVDSVEFADGKVTPNTTSPNTFADTDGFMPIDDSDVLPFN